MHRMLLILIDFFLKGGAVLSPPREIFWGHYESSCFTFVFNFFLYIPTNMKQEYLDRELKIR